MKCEINDTDFGLLKNIELCCREIIIDLEIVYNTEEIYINPISDINDEHRNSFWAVLRNNTLCMSFLRWNNIFGTYSEPTHWSKIPDIDKELVKKKIFKQCRIDEAAWKTAHARANDLRNHFIAHNEFNKSSPNAFKDQELYLNSTNIIRKVVLTIFSKHFSENKYFDEYIRNVTKLSNQELVLQVGNMSKQGVLFSTSHASIKKTKIQK